MISRRKLAHFAPGRFILFSIACTILVGTALLALPIARTAHISLLDLLFTATSATCVTGLFTIPLENFTLFGKTVLLILIQIGGLGLITLTLFLMSLFVNLGLATQLLAGQILEIDSWQNVRKTLILITVFTIAIEIIGAATIFPILIGHYSVSHALFLSIFHAVSSFCNAGISLFSVETHRLLLANHYILLGITTILTFCGSLGFITWFEIGRFVSSLRHKKWYHISLMTKIILYSVVLLITIPALCIWVIEYNHAFAQMSLFQSLYYAFFNSITLRSAGFTIIPLSHFYHASLLIMMIVTFIGSSPGSTGSGTRITTFVIFLTTIKTVILGQLSVNIKGRRISLDQTYKAIAIVSLSLFWILVILFLLLITQKIDSFLALLFESVSAFANLGMSLGITATLNVIGKIFIIISMIGGRIGSLTLILALRKKNLQVQIDDQNVRYPEERVMLS